MANEMLAGGTRRIVRTGPLDNLGDLPLELVRRIWRRVAEVERGTVEWLATRLQSWRRGYKVRRRLVRVNGYLDSWDRNWYNQNNLHLGDTPWQRYQDTIMRERLLSWGILR